MLEMFPNDKKVIKDFIKEMNGMVDNFIPRGLFPSMSVDIIDKKDHFIILADLPGFKKEEILVECKDGRLIISANHKETEEETELDYIKKERFVGEFKRVFNIGDIQEDSITAKYTDGILRVEMKKKEIIDNKRVINID